MIRPIVLYGDDLLRQKAKVVPTAYEELEKLVDDMFETMYAASGIGLAAPQIGIPLQLFVVGGRLADEPDLKTYEEVFVNPRIIDTSEETNDLEEGCLSIPHIRGDVRRSSSLELAYEDRHRQPRRCRLDGLLARIIQHEYDHLQGVLFIDHLSPLKRRLLKKKLARVGSRPEVQYPVQLQKP